MKKSLPTFLTIFLTSLASAGPVEGVEQLLTGLREVLILIVTFAMDVLLDVGQIDQYLFSKIMIFAIVLLVVYTVLKKNEIFGDKGPIIWIISSSIAILAVRFMSDDLVDMTLLQYGSFGIAVTTFLPLMIFLFFLHQSEVGPFARRMGWVIYGIALMSLTISRDVELGDALYIYLAGVLFVILAFLGDTIIHNQFNQAEMRSMKEQHNLFRKIALNKKLEKVREGMDATGISEKERKNLEKQEKKIVKLLKKL